MACFPRSLLLLLTLWSVFGLGVFTSHRQKRGIGKMMMHIMWDPVRLIRYWYAFDVTKEIAKSWRKILPTLMVLPLNPNLSSAPGIAKYVHPTHGLRETHHHKASDSLVYHDLSSSETLSSAEHNGEASGSSLTKHMFAPSNLNTYSGAYQQFVGGDSLNNDPSSGTSLYSELKGLQRNPEFLWQSGMRPSDVNYAVNEGGIKIQSEESIPQYMHLRQMAIPYEQLIHPQNRDSIILKAKPVGEDRLIQHVSYNVKHSNSEGERNTFTAQSPAEQSDFVTKLQGSFDLDGQTHQREIHIMLHPIPISDEKVWNHLRRRRPSLSSNILQALPFSVNFRNSELENLLHYNETQNREIENSTLKTPIDLERIRQQSQVTWVLQSVSNSSDKTNVSDSEAAESNVRIKSLTLNDGEKLVIPNKSSNYRYPLSNGHGINVLKLKEDLKHGTPVLIPFSKSKKNIYASSDAHEVPEKQNEFRGVLDEKRNLFNSVQKGEPNSTQKMVLFLANKKPE